jgi:hypothetical protein
MRGTKQRRATHGEPDSPGLRRSTAALRTDSGADRPTESASLPSRVRVAALRFEIWVNTSGRLTWLVIPGSVVFIVLAVFAYTVGNQELAWALIGSLVVTAIVVSVIVAQIASIPKEHLDAQTRYFHERIAQIQTDDEGHTAPVRRVSPRRLLPLTAFALVGLVLVFVLQAGTKWGSAAAWPLLVAVLVISAAWQRRLYIRLHSEPAEAPLPRANLHDRSGPDHPA